MTSLKNRVALVTAGSRGLGAEIVRQLADNGADVAFTYLQDSAAADNLVKELAGRGRKAVAIQADAADFARAKEAIDRTIGDLGRIDILVCSAGIARSSPIWKVSEEDWDRVLDVTLKSAFNYIRAVSATFMKQTGGKIVCIGSINGLRGRIGTVSYNAAKAGLVGLVKTAAAELGEFNVNVNLVAPGFIETTSQEHTPQIVRDLVKKECAIKRLGTPQDIAPLVVFLASDAGKHITGQTIKVDAGQYL
jgi:3-oxoacyl-[acyl-carrier protein] reductase